MVTPAHDAVSAVWNLYNSMSIDLAVSHGNAEFSGATVDDGWDALPGQVAAAQAELDKLAHTKGTRNEHRHERAVKGALGELHDALVERAAAQAHYLSFEAAVKKVIDGGGSGNMRGLDKARNRVDQAQQRMMADQSTLLYDLENLNADLQQ